MRFVPVKSFEQQAVLSVHRMRQGFVAERTALANRIRGLLAEFGLVLPKGIGHVSKRALVLVDSCEELPEMARQGFARMLEHFRALNAQIKDLEDQILRWHRSNPLSQRIEQIPGIGPLGASAIVASVGDARNFQNGRQFAAWLGLVPKHEGTGGKVRLQGISKRGDTYLRTLLIHGARAAILSAQRWGKSNPWLQAVLARRHPNVAVVAVANKNARTLWALLAHERTFQANHVSRPPLIHGKHASDQIATTPVGVMASA
jgi:transposase